jgi:putative oxidoreductase
MPSFMANRADTFLLVGRILLGVIFVISGFGKLTHLDAFSASLASRGVPMPSAMAMLGAVVEFFGGLAVVVGFQTTWAALLMVLFTAAASLIAHRFWEFADAARQMQQTQFMKNLSILGGFLVLAATGAGRFSIDGLLQKRRAT